MEISLDEIGPWTEVKLDIIRQYAKPYSQILANHPSLYHMYIDGFAGAGLHISRTSGDKIKGSPLNALDVQPPFREIHLCELNPAKVSHLRSLLGHDPRVRIHQGDCNDILVSQVLPTVQRRMYRRAFCLLDPYGLHLSWEVIALAGRLQTIDLLLHFPIMDMNMNALRREGAIEDAAQAARMTRYWGDESWKDAGYSKEATLFGPTDVKNENEVVVGAFADRLRAVAGFKFVAKPLPMKNGIGRTVYYLLFASENKTAHKIISDIFRNKSEQASS